MPWWVLPAAQLYFCITKWDQVRVVNRKDKTLFVKIGKCGGFRVYIGPIYYGPP